MPALKGNKSCKMYNFEKWKMSQGEPKNNRLMGSSIKFVRDVGILFTSVSLVDCSTSGNPCLDICFCASLCCTSFYDFVFFHLLGLQKEKSSY